MTYAFGRVLGSLMVKAQIYFYPPTKPPTFAPRAAALMSVGGADGIERFVAIIPWRSLRSLKSSSPRDLTGWFESSEPSLRKQASIKPTLPKDCP